MNDHRHVLKQYGNMDRYKCTACDMDISCKRGIEFVKEGKYQCMSGRYNESDYSTIFEILRDGGEDK